MESKEFLAKSWDVLSSLVVGREVILNEFNSRRKVTESELRVMLQLQMHGTMIVSDLAYALNMDKGNMSKLVSTLENEKYIKKRKSKRDGRYYHVSLDAKGRRFIKNFIEQSSVIMDEFLQRYDDETLEKMFEGMDIFRGIIKDFRDDLEEEKERQKLEEKRAKRRLI
ncbi:MAG: MarR family transcriptional regulator [Tissierellia bacterium]|nr:MarR family transcriptional regulator [Tissierellia bacterium]